MFFFFKDKIISKNKKTITSNIIFNQANKSKDFNIKKEIINKASKNDCLNDILTKLKIIFSLEK